MTDGRPLAGDDPVRIGAYDLVGRLGEGGQGIVYLGVAPGGGRVAVKLLRVYVAEDDAARGRFVRELENAKRVARFCTAQVLEADLAGDRPYIVSEYVEGRSLAAAVRETGPLSGGALERLAIGTATALAAIHRAGVLHRDFKPQNVLLGPDGPRVIDFGIAKALDSTVTESSGVLGTPAYMAPEQASGQPLSSAVDVFAWASTMVFAASGAPPFGQDTIHAVMGRLLYGRPSFGNFGGPVRDLVHAALVRDPASRPTAEHLLLRLLGHDAAPAERSDLLEVAATLVHTAAESRSGLADAPSPAAGPPALRAAYAAPGPTAPYDPGRPAGGPATPPTGEHGAGHSGPDGYPGPPEYGGRRGRGRWAVLAAATAVIVAGGAVPAYAILHSGTGRGHAAPPRTPAPSNTAQASLTPPATPSSRAPSPGASSPSAHASPSVLSPTPGGPQPVSVPSVAGTPADEAQSTLEGLGFKVFTSTQSSATDPTGTVIRRIPSDSELPAGSKISLVVSSGPGDATVPDVVGSSPLAACNVIRQAGLDCAVEQISDDADPAGLVYATDPAAGSTLSQGDTVTVMVAVAPV